MGIFISHPAKGGTERAIQIKPQSSYRWKFTPQTALFNFYFTGVKKPGQTLYLCDLWELERFLQGRKSGRENPMSLIDKIRNLVYDTMY